MSTMTASFREAQQIGAEKYAYGATKYCYGTAGFRMKADVLDCAMYRVGLGAVLRSQYHGGKSVGVMVTASHNPEQDNGAKIVDPTGDMLENSWEKIVADLANAPNESLDEAIKEIVTKCNIDTSIKAKVIIGYDTRASSIRLSEACVAGIAVLNGQVNNYGLLTTPQLHFMVRCMNDTSYGTPSETGYYNKLAQAFNNLKMLKLDSVPDLKGDAQRILIDAANGVGGPKTKEFIKVCGENSFPAQMFNVGEGSLNHECGADFVKVGQKPPSGMPALVNDKCIVFDGDADRVLFFYIDETRGFRMLDGDKIAILLAAYFKEIVNTLPELQVKLGDSGEKMRIGLIQTAYANGSSTYYAEKVMGLEVGCASTGVKHLHHMAKEFDIGVYFEANGHGTVIYSEAFKEKVASIDESKLADKKQKLSLAQIKEMIDLTNETVGDALSDALLVETVLYLKGMSMKEWDSNYQDLPNRLLKVNVKDRRVITTKDAERQVVTPEGFQQAINETVAAFKNGRSFVRPSGTEDVVRVYAEASTREECHLLAEKVVKLVKKFC